MIVVLDWAHLFIRTVIVVLDWAGADKDICAEEQEVKQTEGEYGNMSVSGRGRKIDLMYSYTCNIPNDTNEQHVP